MRKCISCSQNLGREILITSSNFARHQKSSAHKNALSPTNIDSSWSRVPTPIADIDVSMADISSPTSPDISSQLPSLDVVTQTPPLPPPPPPPINHVWFDEASYYEAGFSNLYSFENGCEEIIYFIFILLVFFLIKLR